MQYFLKNTDFMKDAIAKLQSEGAGTAAWAKIGEITGTFMGHYAPVNTGLLRKSYKINISKDGVTISWGNSGTPADKYAHYQYVGIAMEPVRPIFENSLWTDKWRSPKGVKKHYADDRHPIGVPHTVVFKDGRVAFVKGYTVRGSSDHWIDKAVDTPQVYNPMRRMVYEVLAEAIGKKVVGKKYSNNFKNKSSVGSYGPLPR